MRISNKKLFIDLKYFSSECHSLASYLDDLVIGQQLADKAFEMVQKHSWIKKAEQIERFIGNMKPAGI